MIKRAVRTVGTMLMVMTFVFATACSKNGSQDSNASSDVMETTENYSDSANSDSETAANTETDIRNVVQPLTDYVSEELYAVTDQWPSCDDRALAAVMKKAAAGEKVVIACIGGSITQGTISKGSIDSQTGLKMPYADIFFQWWKDTFPDTEFEFINAGIGGTDSYLGVHRVQADVLDYEPDLVLVKFSVNDADSLFYKKTYDNLVRKILLSESSPAVMLLYMGQTNGATAQASHVFIGFGYQLPMLSYTSLINDMMEQKVYTADELSGDVVHPSALGHAIAGEIIWKYMNNVYSQLDSYEAPDGFTAAAITKDTYLDAGILDSANTDADSMGRFEKKRICTQYPYGWECSKGDGQLEITAEFRNLGILYYATVDGKSGQFDIYIDGEYVKTIDADFAGGWGNAITATQVYTSGESTVHTILIKKSPDSTGDVFDLLGLLVS